MLFFFFNDTATTEIYTLPLHAALPIWPCHAGLRACRLRRGRRPQPTEVRAGYGEYSLHEPRLCAGGVRTAECAHVRRSEEHTSELQSRQYLVCRLLLEKKKKPQTIQRIFNSLAHSPSSTTTCTMSITCTTLLIKDSSYS